MFSIQFDPTSTLPDHMISKTPGKPSKFAKGYIDFGLETVMQRRHEWFISPLHIWSVQDYEKHWLESLEQIVHGQERSALIVNLGSLMHGDFVNWWPMWRLGETIKLHEQLLFLSELSQPFDVSNPYVHVSDYDYGNESDEEGRRPSEWEMPVSDMAAFLDAQSST